MTKRRNQELRKLYAKHTFKQLLESFAFAEKVGNNKISLDHRLVLQDLIAER